MESTGLHMFKCRTLFPTPELLKHNLLGVVFSVEIAYVLIHFSHDFYTLQRVVSHQA